MTDQPKEATPETLRILDNDEPEFVDFLMWLGREHDAWTASFDNLGGRSPVNEEMWMRARAYLLDKENARLLEVERAAKELADEMDRTRARAWDRGTPAIWTDVVAGWSAALRRLVGGE